MPSEGTDRRFTLEGIREALSRWSADGLERIEAALLAAKPEAKTCEVPLGASTFVRLNPAPAASPPARCPASFGELVAQAGPLASGQMAASPPACRPWCGMQYADDHVPFRLNKDGEQQVWFDDDVGDDLDKPARCSGDCRDRARAVPAPVACSVPSSLDFGPLAIPYPGRGADGMPHDFFCDCEPCNAHRGAIAARELDRAKAVPRDLAKEGRAAAREFAARVDKVAGPSAYVDAPPASGGQPGVPDVPDGWMELGDRVPYVPVEPSRPGCDWCAVKRPAADLVGHVCASRPVTGEAVPYSKGGPWVEYETAPGNHPGTPSPKAPEALSVDCPECGAKSGKPCSVPKLSPIDRYHIPRFEAARDAPGKPDEAPLSERMRRSRHCMTPDHIDEFIDAMADLEARLAEAEERKAAAERDRTRLARKADDLRAQLAVEQNRHAEAVRRCQEAEALIRLLREGETAALDKRDAAVLAERERCFAWATHGLIHEGDKWFVQTGGNHRLELDETRFEGIASGAPAPTAGK